MRRICQRFSLSSPRRRGSSSSEVFLLDSRLRGNDIKSGNDIFNSILLLLVLLFFTGQIFAVTSTSIANSLGWVADKTSGNLCKGKYEEPIIISSVPNPPKIKGTETTITADNKVFYSAGGDSILEGNVELSQPGRQIKADKVILHRDPVTNKISTGDFIGHVEVRENGRLLIGEVSHVNFIQKTLTIDNIIYRINAPSPTGEASDFWGSAKSASRDKFEVVTMHHATASSCSPTSCSWHLSSTTTKYDKNKQEAEVYNGALFFEGVPVFYAPYFSFPTSKERKTGFLFPSLAYSANLGPELSLPFYLNLAPNYDATITPRIMARQGVMVDGVFNYLTENSKGSFTADYIYDFGLDILIDSDLKNFDTNNPANPNYKMVKTLKDESKNRGYFAWENETKFDQHWTSQATINYAFDDYFLHDFSFSPNSVNDDQLMNNLSLKYAGENWNFLGQLQAYQTLHMLGLDTQDQYRRLPQLALNGDYPNQAFGFEYLFKSEFVNFSITEPNFDTANPIPTGSRINLQPGISYPLNFASGYIRPTIQVPITFYNLQNFYPNDPSYLKSIDRVVPIINIDSGLVLERNFNMFGSGYMQTLEPRLYYLYVPKIDQSDIPNFDSYLSSFDYNSLFRTNRFSSIDRIGDANQMSAGLTSRFLDANTGQEKLRLDLGQTYAFSKHTILLDEDNDQNLDPLVNNYTSPFIGQATVNLNPSWNAIGSLSVNLNNNMTFLNNVASTLQYKSDPDHIINLNYTFIANGDSIQGETVDLNRIDISAAWLIEKRWRVLADWNYNISVKDYQEALLGIEYNSCCWALRLVAERVFNGYDNNGDSTFDLRGGVQFMLKGLGSLNGGDAASVLPSRISGFKDNFVTGIL
jgi:LPS-assembly protein